MKEEEVEQAILGYLSNNANELETFRSLTTIYEQFNRSPEWKSSFFSNIDGPSSKEALQAVLDQMQADGLLDVRIGEREYEPSYRATDQGVYEAVFEDGHLVTRQIGAETPVAIDSTAWTGLSHVRISNRNAKAISRLIDSALGELGSEHNASTAQARTLLLAAKDLTEAPEPPSDVIWDLIQRAGTVVGLIDIFLRIFSAAIN